MIAVLDNLLWVAWCGVCSTFVLSALMLADAWLRRDR